MAAPFPGHVTRGTTSRLAGPAFLVAVALAAFLRIHNYAEPSMWLDEYGSAWAVAADSYGGAVDRVLLVHNQSPFFYLLAKASSDVFGPGTASLRLPSLIFGIGLVVLAFFLARDLFRDDDAPWIAAVVFAVSERLIWYSQNGRSFSLALFCGLLSWHFYVQLLERDETSRRIGWVLASAAAFYAHFLFGFLVVLQAVHLLWDRGREVLGRRWLGSALALALLSGPGVLQLLQVAGRRRELDWLGEQAWDLAPLLFVDFFTPAVFCAVAVFVLFARRGPTAAELRHPMLLACWLILPWPVFALLPPLFDTHLLFPRYLSFVLPAALLTTVWLLLQAPAGWRRRTAVLVFLVASFVFQLLPALDRNDVFARRPREGWTESGRYLDLAAGPEDLVLYTSGLVEADVVAVAGTDGAALGSPREEELRSYFSWPLRVHLKPALRSVVRCLPARRSAATEAYLGTLLDEAATRRRVWVVGRNAIVREVAASLVERGFREADRRRFHQVEIHELRRREGV